MNPKERFTVVVTQGKYGVKIVRGIYDHKQEKHLTEEEAEKIFLEEYGNQLDLKKMYVGTVVDNIHKEIELYNSICEKGFEITFEDVVNKLKTDKDNGNTRN